ncbi:MAG: hypothetical protein ACRDV9_06965 [Acidimicrobiia bacterium]
MHPVERLRFVAGAQGEHPRLVLPEAADALAELAEDPAVLVTACRRLVESRPRCGATWWLASRVLCALDPRRAAREAAVELELDATAELLSAEFARRTLAMVGSPELASVLGQRPDGAAVYLVGDSPRRSRRARVARSRFAEVELVFPWEIEALMPGLAAAVIEAEAVGPFGALGPPWATQLAALATAAGVPVWLAVGAGRSLPVGLWGAMLSRLPLAGEGEEGAQGEAAPGLLALSEVDCFGSPRGAVSAGELLGQARRCPVAPELLRWPSSGAGGRSELRR